MAITGGLKGGVWNRRTPRKNMKEPQKHPRQNRGRYLHLVLVEGDRKRKRKGGLGFSTGRVATGKLMSETGKVLRGNKSEKEGGGGRHKMVRARESKCESMVGKLGRKKKIVGEENGGKVGDPKGQGLGVLPIDDRGGCIREGNPGRDDKHIGPKR